ncbi:MAG TPA: hypothetical protein VFG86_12870, partial [Chloroflexota bacterium]|nr:hypothetical protein [Chloroflexota bacterium]
MIAPGAEHPSRADEWADALVIVERGCLEVVCQADTRRRFEARAMLCLSWLPLRALRNTGSRPAVLLAIRRRPEQPVDQTTETYHGRR